MSEFTRYGAPDGDGTRRAVLQGEIDLANLHELRSLVASEISSCCGRLELDLSGVEFMDAGGVGMLVELSQLARSRGVELKIVRPSRSVSRLLELCRLDGHLGISNSVDLS